MLPCKTYSLWPVKRGFSENTFSKEDAFCEIVIFLVMDPPPFGGDYPCFSWIGEVGK